MAPQRSGEHQVSGETDRAGQQQQIAQRLGGVLKALKTDSRRLSAPSNAKAIPTPLPMVRSSDRLRTASASTKTGVPVLTTLL